MIQPRAVLFDLLTALLDSWSLWDKAAGGAEDGRRWRLAYLRHTYGAGAYRPYEDMVRAAAVGAGLGLAVSDRLLESWGEIEPWPEVAAVLGALSARVPLGVVTNCSEELGTLAAARTGIAFSCLITAERAGFYKPHPRPYRLALDPLGTTPEATLFVAGSAYDLVGAGGLGMPVFWHDRIGMTPPPEASAPVARAVSLEPLLDLVPGHR